MPQRVLFICDRILLAGVVLLCPLFVSFIVELRQSKCVCACVCLLIEEAGEQQMSSATATTRKNTAPTAANPVLAAGSSETGTVVSHFRIGIEIGRGSFANVYKGVDLTNNKTVAIKSVFRSRLKNQKLVTNLEIEIKILRNLKNPHIVSLLDCVKTDNHFHLVMDYCSLGDLSYFIRKKTQLSNHHPIIKTVLEKYPSPANSNGLNEFLVVNFAKQLSSALKFLRSQNLVHRDIKPQNLLLCSPAHSKDEFLENNYTGFWELPILKVADFGFARYLPSTSMAETLCGSPLYMAPEILRYEKYNAKADLWSVGTVIYEMVVGKPPFRASNHIELLKKIEKSNDQITFPTDFEISRDLIRLICNLLKANPTDRMGFNEFFSDPVITSSSDNFRSIDESISYSVENEEMYVSEYLVGKDLNTQEALVKNEKSVSGKKSTASATAASILKQKAKKQAALNQFEKQIQEPLNKLVIEEGNEDEVESNSSEDKYNEDPTTNLKSNVSNGIVTRETIESKIRPKSMEKSVEELLQEQQKAIKGDDNISDKTGNTTTTYSNAKSNTIVPSNVKLNGHGQAQNKGRSKIGNDIVVEKDYVVVEKRNVEVNTFADEISKASKPSRNPERHSLSKQRRYSMSVSPSGALKEVLDYTTERLFGATNTNTNPVANVDTDDNNNDSSTSAKGVETRAKVTNEPNLSEDKVDINKIILSRTNSIKNTGTESSDKNDQIDGIINKIERLAMMAHAISLYAEIKFDQVIPLPPSSNNESNNFIDVYEFDEYNKYSGTTGDDQEKTISNNGNNNNNNNTLQYNLFYRKLCQEGLVLYLKTLLFLGEAVKASSEWWAKNKFKSNITPMMGELIQWIRNRFNESLEKAEYLKLRMNRYEEDETTDEIAEPTFICEKIIFDRAIEISKDTAIKELNYANDINELKKCEISYSVSVWMLESLLYQTKDGEGGVLERGDQKIVENFINSIGTRLLVLKSKIDSQTKSN